MLHVVAVSVSVAVFVAVAVAAAAAAAAAAGAAAGGVVVVGDKKQLPNIVVTCCKSGISKGHYSTRDRVEGLERC